VLSRDSLERLAVQWQTSFLNVAREYVQNVFLSYLYQAPESDRVAFKGGTALRILHRSPRFSEDMDFSANLKPYHIGNLLAHTTRAVAREAIPLEVLESKATSGGFLALYTCELYSQNLQIELNISLRARAAAEPALVVSPLLPPYQCMALPLRDLVGEKIAALLARRQPRDFFDLYFLLRGRLGLEAVIPKKKQLLQAIEGLDPKPLQKELKLFLPVSHHKTIANLPAALRSELNRL
jgi:predicted nucleotidyltransferase component of viral defense system